MEIKSEQELIMLKNKVKEIYFKKIEVLCDQLDEIYERNKDNNYLYDLAPIDLDEEKINYND